MKYGSFIFENFDEFLNTTDTMAHLIKEYEHVKKFIGDSDEMSNIKIRHTESGMGISFQFQRVRGIGMHELNIVRIHAILKEYLVAYKW